MATKTKNKKKKVTLCVMVVTACLVLAGAWGVLSHPETALAEKPVPVLGDAGFCPHDGFGEEISMMPFECNLVTGAWKRYRTVFGTGNVVVTLLDGTTTTVLDHNPFLIRLTDDSGVRYLVFRIGVQDGHKNKDRFSTPTEGIGEPGDTVIPFPFPEEVWNSGGADPGAPSLEVVAGGVDENLDMLPGAQVILHLHVEDVPLIRMSGKNAGEVIGSISVGDIGFTFPES